MNGIKYLILIVLLLFSVNASADFYKYVDENGNVRFTDDINEVPETQRSESNSYVESQSEEVPEQQEALENQAEPEAAAPSGQQANFPDFSDEEDQSLEDTKAQLDDLKAQIDEEHAALKKAQEDLLKEKEQAKTRAQIIEYNKKIDALNTRIRAYAENVKAYETGVDAYNQRIMEKNKQKNAQTE